MFEVVSYLQDLKRAAFSFFEALATQHPEWLFIIRLHPNKFEDYERQYQGLLALPNVVCNSEGDIGPLIHSSDLVVAARSGALVDAHFLRVPAVNLLLEQHPFVDAGVVRTLEQDFARSVAIDDGYEGGLDGFFSLDTASVGPLRRHWFRGEGAAVFDEVVSFIEEIAARPALAKKPKLECFANRFVLQRYLRNRIRLLGFGGDRRGPRPRFDYGQVFARLSENAQ
jgi:hypothetical protein